MSHIYLDMHHGYPCLSLTYTVFAGYFAHHDIHLSWTTQRTSPLKSVGLPCPSFISPAVLDPGMGCRQQAVAGPMKTRRVVKLNKPSPTPILHVGPVSNVLGRVPLMPLFLIRNSTPTILHCFCNLQRKQIPVLLCRRRQGVGQEGKQRLLGESMVVIMPPGPKGGAMLQRWLLPNEARNESRLTRKDIHATTMVVSKYEQISQGYLDL